MWACHHADTFLPEIPFSGETEIVSEITEKFVGLKKTCVFCLVLVYAKVKGYSLHLLEFVHVHMCWDGRCVLV